MDAARNEDEYRRFVAEKQHVKIENVEVEIGRPWRIKEFGPPTDYKPEEFTVWSFLVGGTGRHTQETTEKLEPIHTKKP